MKLRPHEIHLIRAGVLWTLRSVAVIVLSVGLYLCLKMLLFAIGSGVGIGDMLQVFTGVGESHSLYRGLAMLVVGGVLAGLSGLISGWIVRPPAEGCPRCGHPRSPGGGDTCPECGLRGFGEED